MAFTRIRTARKHIALDYVYQQWLRISFLTFSRLPCNLSQAYTYIYVNTQTYTRTHTHTSCVHPGATNGHPWASSGKSSPAVGPRRCWGVWLASACSSSGGSTCTILWGVETHSAGGSPWSTEKYKTASEKKLKARRKSKTWNKNGTAALHRKREPLSGGGILSFRQLVIDLSIYVLRQQMKNGTHTHTVSPPLPLHHRTMRGQWRWRKKDRKVIFDVFKKNKNKKQTKTTKKWKFKWQQKETYRKTNKQTKKKASERETASSVQCSQAVAVLQPERGPSSRRPLASPPERTQRYATLRNATLRCSVQLLQDGGHVDQAELAAKVTDDGGIVQHQQLPHTLALAALAQVHSLQQVSKVQVPEGDAALATGHQQTLRDHPETGPTAHLLR